MKEEFKFLFNQPNLNKSVILIITPLAPLSITNQKGTYLKSHILPSKNQISGMLENILRMYIPTNMRVKICDAFKLDKEYSIPYNKKQSYVPLINNHYTIDKIYTPKNVKFFDDYSSHLYKRKDKAHINGSRHVDKSLYYTTRDDINTMSQTINVFDKLPTFYNTNIKREYFTTNECYKICATLDNDFYLALNESLSLNNVAYLGNSESLVKIELLAQ